MFVVFDLLYSNIFKNGAGCLLSSYRHMTVANL